MVDPLDCCSFSKGKRSRVEHDREEEKEVSIAIRKVSQSFLLLRELSQHLLALYLRGPVVVPGRNRHQLIDILP